MSLSWMYWINSKRFAMYAPGGSHYRCQTVPGTRKYKASGRYYRVIYTTQERSEINFLAHDEDARYHKISYARRAQLPHAYDDPIDSAYCNRNWKQYRKTRYKLKG